MADYDQALIDGVDDGILRLHEHTLSDDPMVATGARCMKMLTPAILNWVDTELARGTAPSDIVLAAKDAVFSALGSVLFSIMKPEGVARALDVLAEDLAPQMRMAAEFARKEASK